MASASIVERACRRSGLIQQRAPRAPNNTATAYPAAWNVCPSARTIITMTPTAMRIIETVRSRIPWAARICARRAVACNMTGSFGGGPVRSALDTYR